MPALGTYDDRDPAEVGRRVALARAHGVDALIYGFFWCRGKRVFQDALDHGFLGSPEGRSMPFALMWANRMPRRVLPVRRADLPVVEDERRVTSDVADFVRFVSYVARRYFTLPHYVRVAGSAYLSIYDSTFFVREMGAAAAREAVSAARRHLADEGLPGLHLAAIDPAAEVISDLRAIGFDSVTHYVLLPEWRGPFLQDYDVCARRRAGEWQGFADRSGLPYMPAVATGWDASPRGADFGPARPDRYPWSPVVVGEHPERFHAALRRAVRFTLRHGAEDPLLPVASLNEWTEGHHLEPDARFGSGWLEAVRDAR